MILNAHSSLGFLPSLEILPLFERGFHSACPIKLVPFSSYGGIARAMLTGRLSGGIMPWEIFISDVLALPGERAHWRLPLFLQACPTELVIRDRVRRSLRLSKNVTVSKRPSGPLTIGIEGRDSLTRGQFNHWLAGLRLPSPPAVIFRTLPVDLMIQALRAEAIDGFVAPSPWGLFAEDRGSASIETSFDPGRFVQRLAVVQRRTGTLPACSIDVVVQQLATARASLRTHAEARAACALMGGSGRPALPGSSVLDAIRRYENLPPAEDIPPDTRLLVNELRHLAAVSSLPPQISPDDQTARLLVN